LMIAFQTAPLSAPLTGQPMKSCGRRHRTSLRRGGCLPFVAISPAFVHGHRTGHLTRERILSTITLYWLTRTGVSSARSYSKNARAAALAGGQVPPPVTLPVGFTTFPDEIFPAPRTWVVKAYANLTYFHTAARAATSRRASSRDCVPARSARPSGRSAGRPAPAAPPASRDS